MQTCRQDLGQDAADYDQPQENPRGGAETGGQLEALVLQSIAQGALCGLLGSVLMALLCDQVVGGGSVTVGGGGEIPGTLLRMEGGEFQGQFETRRMTISVQKRVSLSAYAGNFLLSCQ